MTLIEMMEHERGDILEDAVVCLGRSQVKGYKQAGPEQTRKRLQVVFDLTLKGVKERNLGPMVAHADSIAKERFEGGFDLWEVQTAFNVLEETLWTRILANLPLNEQAEALGLTSTVLGAGKDALARKYVSLASKSKVQTLDLRSLFLGT
jgi:hypothetical protein